MPGIAVFLAVLFGYALLSRWFERISVTPHILVVVAGLAFAALRAGDARELTEVETLQLAGELALVLALFVDASRSDVVALRRAAMLPVRLLLIGLPLTIVAGWVVAAMLFPEIDLAHAFIIAALVAPTDAALGSVVVNSTRVPVRIRQALNVESGLNDGLVTPLVLVAVAYVTAGGGEGTTGWIGEAVGEVGLGVLVGVFVGGGGAIALRLAERRSLIAPATRWVIAPTMALLAWWAGHAVGGNVFIAAFSAGLALTVVHGRVRPAYLEFADGVGELAGLGVFFLFGALLPDLPLLDPPVIVFGVAALTVVRMVPVAVATIGAGLAAPTVGFLGWFGPRGLASIVLGLMATGSGLPLADDPRIAAAVAMTVLLSVVAHGLTATPFVQRYAVMARRLPASAAEHEASVEIASRTASLRQGRAATIEGTEEGP